MAIDNGGAQARVTEHETKQQLFLHDLEERGGVLFYAPLVEQTIHGGLAVATLSS
jgi:hypothetical protein